jgi:hypothetical protein
MHYSAVASSAPRGASFTGVLPAFDVLERIAATVRDGSKLRRDGERGSGRRDHRHPSLGRSII